MAQQEPPELTDRNGEKIVVFRDGHGNFFSNHPDYPMALALHENAKAQAAQLAPTPAPEPDEEIEDDEATEPDNADGKVEYSELQSKDLVAEAKSRGLTIPSGTKRSEVIRMLEADDQAKAQANS